MNFDCVFLMYTHPSIKGSPNMDGFSWFPFVQGKWEVLGSAVWISLWHALDAVLCLCWVFSSLGWHLLLVSLTKILLQLYVYIVTAGRYTGTMYMFILGCTRALSKHHASPASSLRKFPWAERSILYINRISALNKLTSPSQGFIQSLAIPFFEQKLL